MRKTTQCEPSAELNEAKALKQGWRIDKDYFWVRKVSNRTHWPFSGGMGFIDEGKVYARFAYLAIAFDDLTGRQAHKEKNKA